MNQNLAQSKRNWCGVTHWNCPMKKGLTLLPGFFRVFKNLAKTQLIVILAAFRVCGKFSGFSRFSQFSIAICAMVWMVIHPKGWVLLVKNGYGTNSTERSDSRRTRTRTRSSRSRRSHLHHPVESNYHEPQAIFLPHELMVYRGACSLGNLEPPFNVQKILTSWEMI